jgi:hypothetical protein
MRPARSHDSLATPMDGPMSFSDLHHVPSTPGVMESPLNFHKRQSSQPTTTSEGSSAYLKHLLRQNGEFKGLLITRAARKDLNRYFSIVKMPKYFFCYLFFHRNPPNFSPVKRGIMTLSNLRLLLAALKYKNMVRRFVNFQPRVFTIYRRNLFSNVGGV